MLEELATSFPCISKLSKLSCQCTRGVLKKAIGGFFQWGNNTPRPLARAPLSRGDLKKFISFKICVICGLKNLPEPQSYWIIANLPIWVFPVAMSFTCQIYQPLEISILKRFFMSQNSVPPFQK